MTHLKNNNNNNKAIQEQLYGLLFEISRYVNIKTRQNICRLYVILNAIQHAWKANDPKYMRQTYLYKI